MCLRISLAEVYQDKPLMKQLEQKKPADPENAEVGPGLPPPPPVVLAARVEIVDTCFCRNVLKCSRSTSGCCGRSSAPL